MAGDGTGTEIDRGSPVQYPRGTCYASCVLSDKALEGKQFGAFIRVLVGGGIVPRRAAGEP